MQSDYCIDQRRNGCLIFGFFARTCIFSFSKLANEFMLLMEFCVMTLCASRSFAIISLLLTRNAGIGAIEWRRRNFGLSKRVTDEVSWEFSQPHKSTRTHKNFLRGSIQFPKKCSKIWLENDERKPSIKLKCDRISGRERTRQRCDRDRVATRTGDELRAGSE